MIPLTSDKIMSMASAGMPETSMLTRYAGPVDTLVPNPVITRAMHLGTGLQRAQLFGSLLIPTFNRTTAKVLVRSSGNEHLIVRDTSIGLQEPYKFAQFREDSEEFGMALLGFKFGVDRVQATRFSDPLFELTVGAAMRAQWAIDMDVENRLALLFGDPLNYPVLHRLDAVGAPWNAGGGDSRADIRVIEDQILTTRPGLASRQNFKGWMTQSVWRAAQDDPTWNAIRDNTTQDAGSVESFERYLGWTPGSITIADTVANEDGVLRSLWDELMIITLDTSSPEFVAPFGDTPFGLLHDMGVTNVFASWFEDNIRTDWYPVMRSILPVAHDLTKGGIIFNQVA